MRLLTLLLIFLISLISINIINAQSDFITTDAAVQQETQQIVQDTAQDPSLENVGITPDQAGYGLKLGLEKVGLFFTFDKTKKAEKALNLADLRLKEARLMIAKNNFNALDKIREQHKTYIDIAQRNIKGLGKDQNSLETQANLETQLEEQQNEVDAIESLTLVNANEITDEQQQEVASLIQDTETGNNETGKEIQDESDAVTMKLKDNGLTEEKINEMLSMYKNQSKNFTHEDILNRKATYEVEQADKMYNLASRLIEKFQNAKLNNTNITLDNRTFGLHEKALEVLNQAKSDLEAKKYFSAIEHASYSKRLSTLTIASIYHGVNNRFINNKALQDRLKGKLQQAYKNNEKGPMMYPKMKDKTEEEDNSGSGNDQENDTSEGEQSTPDTNSGYGY